MCEYMRRTSLRAHDLVLRLRADALLQSPEDMYAFKDIGDSDMYFVRKPRGYSVKGRFSSHANATYWCERVWITRPSGMDYILNLVRRPTPLIYDPSCRLRCCGFCSEEQSENQLRRANASLKLLLWNTYMVRIHPSLFPDVEFVRKASCHTLGK
jgi:hypothetical protein